MEEKKKSRSWVKDAAIIFLVVLLVLTFFSNTILNRSLPEVATVYVAEGTITNKVRGTGTVSARENYEVTIDQTRKVQTVLVRLGDEVNVGDVLFVLQPGESDELENAQQALKQAQKNLQAAEDDYQRWLLTLSDADYYEDDMRISDAREALLEAREACDELAITEEVLAKYEEDLAEVDQKLAGVEERILLQEDLILIQQELVDTCTMSVEELEHDADGVQREYELEMRELEELQHEQELIIREKEAILADAEAELQALRTEKQEEVDKAEEAWKKIDSEIQDIWGAGEHKDAEFDAVEEARAVYQAKKLETQDAEHELSVAMAVYSDDYNVLVREATFMEYDARASQIMADAEQVYRRSNQIDRNEELTEDDMAAIVDLASNRIDALGRRTAYVARELDVYLPAAAEKLAATPMGIAYSEIQRARQNVEKAEDAEDEAAAAYDKAYDEYRLKRADDLEFQRMDQRREKAKALWDSAQEAMDKALEPYEAAVSEAKEELNIANNELDEIKYDKQDLEFHKGQLSSDGLNDARTALSAAKDRLTELTTELDTVLLKEKDDLTKEEDDLKSGMEQREKDYKEAQDRVKEKERALEKELRSLEQQKKEDGKQSVRDSIQRRDYLNDIEEKREKVEEARADLEELSNADNGTEVVASVAGTIQDLNVSAGHKAEAGNVLAVIEVPDLGYSMSFSVTTEQARRLKVGDSATVSNYYWGSQIVCTLVSIQTDPQNPQGSRILNFDVTGDVTAGNSLTISVGERNANYDMVVPNSAVRSDTNGSFVLMVTAKNSPLGNRYFATRVNVEVVASDDQYSAISGAIEAYDSVITTASRNAPISSGDQVRLADSNNT